MNPFLLQLVGILVRQLLLMLFGALGITHLVQPLIDQYMTDWNQLVLSIAGALIVGVYAAWRAFRGRQKLLQACAQAGVTEATIEQRVLSTMIPTPSVTTPKTEIPGGRL